MSVPNAAAVVPESLAQAAAYGSNVFDTVLQRCKDLPRLAQIQRAPTSWADAQAAVQARDEEQRRFEQLRKEASKCKSTPEPFIPNPPQPGVAIGSVVEASAFWMFVEDYFRDVSYEDLLLLVPHCRDVSQDEALYVPHLGRDKLVATKPGTKNKLVSRNSQMFGADTAEDPNERRSSRRRDTADEAISLSMPSAWADSLIQAIGPNGQRLNTMLQGCMDNEVTAISQLLVKLGLLSTQPVQPDTVQQQLTSVSAQAGQFMHGYEPLPALHQQPASLDDRAAIEAMLKTVVGMVGVACIDTAPAIEPPPLPRKSQVNLASLPLLALADTPSAATPSAAQTPAADPPQAATPVPEPSTSAMAATPGPFLDIAATPTVPASSPDSEPSATPAATEAAAVAATDMDASTAPLPPQSKHTAADPSEAAGVSAPAPTSDASAALAAPTGAAPSAKVAEALMDPTGDAAPSSTVADAPEEAGRSTSPTLPSGADPQTTAAAQAAPAADATTEAADPEAIIATAAPRAGTPTATMTATPSTAPSSAEPANTAEVPAPSAPGPSTDALDAAVTPEPSLPMEAAAAPPAITTTTAAVVAAATPEPTAPHAARTLTSQRINPNTDPAVGQSVPACPAQIPDSTIPPASPSVVLNLRPSVTPPAPTPAALAPPPAKEGSTTLTAPTPADPSHSTGAPPRAPGQMPFSGLPTEQADFVHPLTQLMLARPPTTYVLDPNAQAVVDDTEVEALEAAQPAASGGTPVQAQGKTPASGVAGSKRGRPSNKMLAARAAAAAAAAAAANSGLATSQGAPAPTTSQGDSQQPTVAVSGAADGGTRGPSSTATSGNVKVEPEDEAGAGTGPAGKVLQPAATPPAAAASTGRQKRGPKHKGGAGGGTSFGKSGPGQTGARGGARGGDVPHTPLAAAVASCCAAGGPEEGLEAQWSVLEGNLDLVGVAPDDEVLAEILALQSELIQQVAINRRRVASLVQRVVDDLPAQQKRAEERRALEADIRNYLQRKTEIKRNQKREQMQQKRAAMASFDGLDLGGGSGGGPRGRPRAKAGRAGANGSMDGGAAGDGDGQGGDGGSESREPSLERTFAEAAAGPLEDIYATRGEEEEAMCAVCGDGSSNEGNEILFCERCDLAVHQDCYGLATIPDGEWLCWPCLEYENGLRAAGKEQSEIRPQRWEMAARGLTHRDLPGGSHEVPCALCPVKRGAFKRSQDGRDWLHLVCALWHVETDVVPGPGKEVVTGVDKLKPDRWAAPCGVCKLTQGATVKCAYGPCQQNFHPLCGRRVGNYLTTKANASFSKLIYRAYCHQHTPIMLQKDTAQDNTKPTQAAVDIRRPEIRKEVPGGTRTKKDRAAARAAEEALSSGAFDSDEGLESADGGWDVSTDGGTSRSRSRAGRGSGVMGRGGSKAGGRGTAKRGTRPAAVAARAKQALLLEAEEAREEEEVAQGRSGRRRDVGGQELDVGLGDGGLGMAWQTPLEAEADQLQAVRWELEVLRNLITQVVKREKVSRQVCRELRELEIARQQDPVAAASALLSVHGPEQLANLPPAPGTSALDEANAWWFANHPPSSSEAGAGPSQPPIGLHLGGTTAPWPTSTGSTAFSSHQGDVSPTGTAPKKRGASSAAGGAKRKRDQIATTASKELAIDELIVNSGLDMTGGGMLQQMAPPPPPHKPPPKKKQKAAGGQQQSAADQQAAAGAGAFMPLGLSLEGPGGFTLSQFAPMPPQPPPAGGLTPAPSSSGAEGNKNKRRKKVGTSPPPPTSSYGSAGQPQEVNGVVAPPPPPLQTGGPRLPPLAGYPAPVMAPPPPTNSAPAAAQPAAKPARVRAKGAGGRAAAPVPPLLIPALNVMQPPLPPMAVPPPGTSPDGSPTDGQQEDAAGVGAAGRQRGSTGQRQRQPTAKTVMAKSGSPRKRGAATVQQLQSPSQHQHQSLPEQQQQQQDKPQLQQLMTGRSSPVELTAEEDQELARLLDGDSDAFDTGLMSSGSDANLLMQQMQAMDSGGYMGQGQGFQGYPDMGFMMGGLEGQVDLPNMSAPPSQQQGNARQRNTRAWNARGSG